MGENKHINELDAFSKKYIKEIKIEKPSEDFTLNLMNKILSTKNAKVFKFKPLISKKIWYLLLGSIIVLFFIPIKKSKESLFNLPTPELTFLDGIQVPNLFENLSFSNTTVYAVLLFSLMIIAQVVFLKGYFEKRIN